jgi:tetratricopeptide (TPR) repeat protein
MKKSWIILLLIVLGSAAHAQSAREDSLWKVYYAHKGESSAVLSLIGIVSEVYPRDKTLAEKIANKAVYEARALKDAALVCKATIRLAHTYFDNGKYEEAYYLSEEILKGSKEVRDELSEAEAYKIIGRRFHFRGEYVRSLEFYLKALAILEQNKKEILAGEIHNLMGGIYLNQRDYKNARLYYRKSQLVAFKIHKLVGIAAGYLNIANVMIGEHQFAEARNFLDSSMVYYDKAGHEEGKAFVYGTYSDIFMAEAKNDSALDYLLISYNILKKSNKFYTLAQVNSAIADLYFKKKDFQKALYYVDEGIEVCQRTGQIHNIAPLFLSRSRIYEGSGKIKEALESYKLYKSYADTAINAGSIRKQTEDAMKYDYSKKEYQQELEKQALLAEQHERETRNRYIITATVLGMVLLSVILFLVIRSYRNNQRSSRIIAEQKAEVEKKHKELEQKNKEVLDSIYYAKRIQNSLLPTDKFISRILKKK